MLFLGIILVYVLIGLGWSIWVTLAMLDTFSNTAEAMMCIILNVLFWPLIMILALAAGKFFNGLGGN